MATEDPYNWQLNESWSKCLTKILNVFISFGTPFAFLSVFARGLDRILMRGSAAALQIKQQIMWVNPNQQHLIKWDNCRNWWGQPDTDPEARSALSWANIEMKPNLWALGSWKMTNLGKPGLWSWAKLKLSSLTILLFFRAGWSYAAKNC